MKHDMINHILTLERLYAGSEKEQAQEYTKELKAALSGVAVGNMKSGNPVTSRSNTDGHGYSLNNIRKVANKYFGDIDIVLKDEKFLLSIMLIME